MSRTIAKARAVRDLIWTVNSPSLLAPRKDNHEALRLLTAGEIDGDALFEFVNQPDEYRVGRYFERLIHFYLARIQRFEIVTQGEQIQQAGRTIGELDFVFRNHCGTLEHWETAVKFYLHRAPADGCGSHLVGPNPSDHFEKKLQRLVEHQLPLSASVYTNISVRRAFVKGRIFYHLRNNDVDTDTLPPALSTDHLRGEWFYEYQTEEFLKHYSASDYCFRLLTKPHWLADDFMPHRDQSLLSHQGIAQAVTLHFAELQRPLLISVLSGPGLPLIESNRAFVVSSAWPKL